MSDDAARRSAKNAVVTGDMTCNAADGCAFKAALRIGRSAHQSDCKRQSGAA
jgi:hypothetical protein